MRLEVFGTDAFRTGMDVSELRNASRQGRERGEEHPYRGGTTLYAIIEDFSGTGRQPGIARPTWKASETLRGSKRVHFTGITGLQSRECQNPMPLANLPPCGVPAGSRLILPMAGIYVWRFGSRRDRRSLTDVGRIRAFTRASSTTG